MAILDEVKKMQMQGLSESEVVKTLQEKGVSYRDISMALEQSKIKAAVENEAPEAPDKYSGYESTNQQEAQDRQMYTESYSQMQPSVMEEGQAPEYAPQEYSQDQYPGYESYQAQSLSSDTITEISEQIISERLSDIRKHIEKVSDFKTSTEAKIEYLEERLKRIEKIIDTLQASVLRKIGDYVTDVKDIKSELIETQKTFTKLVPEIRKKASKHKK